MLFIATPLYNGQVCVEYLHGMLQTSALFSRQGLPVEYAFERSTYIAVNREKLARRFLATDCRFFFYLLMPTPHSLPQMFCHCLQPMWTWLVLCTDTEHWSQQEK